MPRLHGLLGLTEGDDVIAAQEGDGTFVFDGLYCDVAGILIAPELIVADVACAHVINDLKGPGFVSFQAVHLDWAAKAIYGDSQTFSGCYQIGLIIFDHAGCLSGSLPNCARWPVSVN